MGNYYGISLAGDQWCCANLDTSSGAATRYFEHVEQLPEKFRGQKILKNLEQCVSLSRYLTADEANTSINKGDGDICNSLAQELRNANLHGYFKEHIDSESDGTVTIGIAHSYGVSRTVRRALPVLMGLRPIEQNRQSANESVLSIHPKVTSSVERACAVELPFAICLELLAQHLVCPPALIVTVVVVANGFEVTTVSQTVEGSTLKQSVVDHRTISTDVCPDSGRIWALRIRQSIEPNSIVTIVHACRDETDCVSMLKQSLMVLTAAVQTVSELKPTDFAAGAARYAALCSNEDVGIILDDERLEKIDFSSIAPRPIGVCGQNSKGELLWCPLVEAGDRLGIGNPHKIRFQGNRLIPSRLILAECLQSERSPGEWVTDSKLLRWYADVPVDVTRETRDGSVEIVIESSTGCRLYGWSDPFIRGSFVPKPA